MGWLSFIILGLIAIVGSIIVLLIWGLITRGSRRAT